MAAKVLLISINRCQDPDPVFPLGLAHLNSALRRAGHQTRWLDLLASAAPLPEVLAQFHPDFVGVSLRNIDDVIITKQETYYGDLAAVCASVRQSSPCPVILGGSGFSLFPQRLLDLCGADFGIQGEGEQSFLQLIAALQQRRPVVDIPGLVYRHGDAIAVNPPLPLAADAPVAVADRPTDIVDYYLRLGGMLNVQTQRGCAQACCYCTYPLIEGPSHRRRPPAEVAEEMASLHARGASYVFIVDSILNSSSTHVAETCEALIRRKLPLRWACFLRPQGLTAELMSLMARAGLAHIEYGADSFSDAVLAAYDKRFAFADVLHANELASRAGIDCCHYLICGGPGETLQTLEESYRNSLRLQGAIMLAVVGMRIYPGTALHRRALREGVVSSDTDLLPPRYYLSPGLTAEAVTERLRSFSSQNPAWIVGDPQPGYQRLVERLRQRGLAGPLWSYLALLQRLRPGDLAAS